MSNTPGAQAQASKHAGRNRPSDIDRDNIADASGVGDMASRQYAQAHDVMRLPFFRRHLMKKKPLTKS